MQAEGQRPAGDMAWGELAARSEAGPAAEAEACPSSPVRGKAEQVAHLAPGDTSGSHHATAGAARQVALKKSRSRVERGQGEACALLAVHLDALAR